MAKTKAEKQREAKVRTEQRAQLTAEQQFDIIKHRRGESNKETQRLLKTIDAQHAAEQVTKAETDAKKERGIKKRIRNLAKGSTQRKRGH